MFLLTLCLQLMAMNLLAISKDKHFKQIFKRFPNQSEVRFIRALGVLFCLLALSFLEPLGWTMAALYGVSQVAIAIFFTSLLLRENKSIRKAKKRSARSADSYDLDDA